MYATNRSAMFWSMYVDRGTCAKVNRCTSLLTGDKLHSVSECRSVPPLVLEGVQKKWRLVDPVQCSRQSLQPLFRRCYEVVDPPSIAEIESRVTPLIPSLPQKTFDNLQDCTATSEVTFETICILNCSQSVPRSLEVRGIMTVMNSPLISTRELPPLETSSIPHCFAPKPCHPLKLHRIDPHNIGGEITEVSVILSSFTPVCSSLCIRKNQVHITNTPQRLSRDETKGQKWPYGLRELGSERYTYTMDDASGRVAAFSTMPKSNISASGNTGKSPSCQEDRLKGAEISSLESKSESNSRGLKSDMHISHTNLQHMYLTKVHTAQAKDYFGGIARRIPPALVQIGRCPWLRGEKDCCHLILDVETITVVSFIPNHLMDSYILRVQKMLCTPCHLRRATIPRHIPSTRREMKFLTFRKIVEAEKAKGAGTIPGVVGTVAVTRGMVDETVKIMTIKTTEKSHRSERYRRRQRWLVIFVEVNVLG